MNLFNNFFTLEGGEGVGKSTVALEIEKILRQKEQDVLLTREPGGNLIAEKIRSIILDNTINPKTEVLLFAAARIEHLQGTIIPALNKGQIVISDRYVDSSIVYQEMVKKIDFVTEINDFAIENAIPNQTFILNLDPEIALTRIKDNQREVNRFDQEDLDFHKEIQKKFLKLARDNPRFIIIDASQSPLEIALEIVGYMEQEC